MNKIKTYEAWAKSEVTLFPHDLIDEEILDYFLCVLPPIFLINSGDKLLFQVPETCSHKDGFATYTTCLRVGDKCIYLGELTRKDALLFANAVIN